MSNDIDSVMTSSRPSPAQQRSVEPSKIAKHQDSSARNLQGPSSQAPKEMSAEEVGQVVDAVNQVLQTQSTAVRFKVDKKDGQLVTSIYNTDTHEVIREIPSRELREISARLKEYQSATDQAGLLVDQLV
ncbi:flagellar protein FlaG [Celerinatantimonas yamalensis]|uniref:Flagellar protein FlaG n=1 Tax=Celerinatantimonas yamalensis TaxID=559956 RepID=A0ABW9G601_9GAMM